MNTQNIILRVAGVISWQWLASGHGTVGELFGPHSTMASGVDGTHGRKGGVLREHPLRMCAWLGKPDFSRQRPVD